MNNLSKSTIAAAAFAAAAWAAPAQALPLTETFGTTSGGGATLTANYVAGTGGDANTGTGGLFYATSINSGDRYTISGLQFTAPTQAGANGDVLAFTTQNRTLTQTASTATNSSGTISFPFTVTWGTYTFSSSFATYNAANSVGLQGNQAGTGNQTLTVSYVGVFTDSSNTITTQGAAISETFSQSFSGVGSPLGGISYSANFATSPNFTPVAEPVSMSILAAGLLGLAAVRRRRA